MELRHVKFVITLLNEIYSTAGSIIVPGVNTSVDFQLRRLLERFTAKITFITSDVGMTDLVGL